MTKIGILLLFCAIMVATYPANAFDWSRIRTSKELNSVEPSNFSIITKLELAALIDNPEICSGFTELQISKIPGILFGEFSGECFHHFDKACRGFSNPTMITNITADAFKRFSSICISCFSNVVFENINAEQLKTLDSDKCSRLAGDRLAHINISALSEITSECVSGLSKACSSLNPNIVEAMNPSALNGLTKDCFGHAPFNVLSKIDGNHLAALPQNICAMMTEDILSSIPSDAFAGLKPFCMANLRDGVCTGFKEQSFMRISPVTIGQMTGYCFLSLPSESVGVISKEQVHYLDGYVCHVFNDEILNYFPDAAFEGFTWSCVKEWDDANCADLNGNRFKLLDLSIIQNLKFSCANNLPKSYFTSATTDQIANFSDGTCASFETNLPTFQDSDFSKFSSFTPQCVGHFEKVTCGALSPEGFGNLTALAYESLSVDCFENMTAFAFKYTNKEQVGHLSSRICEELKPSVLQNLPVESYSGFSKDCLNQWTVKQCKGLSGYALNYISDKSFSGLKESCLISLSPTTISQIIEAKVYLMPNEWFSALSNDQVAAFDVHVMNSLSCSQASLLKSCAGLKADQLSEFSTLHCVSIKCWEDIKPSALVDIGSMVAKTFTSDLCSVISPTQLSAFNKWAISSFPVNCIKSLPRLSIAGFTASNIELLGIAQCKAFTKAQFEMIDPAVLSKINGDCASALDVSICSSLVSEQLQAFPVSAFKRLSKDCIASFSKAQYDVLSRSQITSVPPKVFHTYCANDVPILDFLKKFPHLPYLVTIEQSDALMYSFDCFEKINDLFVDGTLKGSMNYTYSSNALNTLFVKDDGFKDLSDFLINSIPMNKVEGIRQAHAQYFSFHQLSIVPDYFFMNNQPTFLLGINDERIQAIQTFNSLARQFNYVGVDAIPHISDKQIRMMSSGMNICLEQANAFTNHQKSVMSTALLQKVSDVIKKGEFHCPPQSLPSRHSSSSSSSSPSSSGNNHQILMKISGIVLGFLLLFVVFKIGTCNHKKGNNNSISMTEPLLSKPHDEEQTISMSAASGSTYDKKSLSTLNSATMVTKDITKNISPSLVDGAILHQQKVQKQQLIMQQFVRDSPTPDPQALQQQLLLRQQILRRQQQQQQQPPMQFHNQSHMMNLVSNEGDSLIQQQLLLRQQIFQQQQQQLQNISDIPLKRENPLLPQFNVGTMSQLESVIAAKEDSSSSENEPWR